MTIPARVTDAIKVSVATKSDVARLEALIRSEIARLDASTHADLAALETRMTLRMGGIVVTAMGALFALLRFTGQQP